jgi:hypothetical protein
MIPVFYVQYPVGFASTLFPDFSKSGIILDVKVLGLGHFNRGFPQKDYLF